MRNGLTVGIAALLCAVALGAPAPAQACGGFFCNRDVPVNQAAERIVFAVGPDGSMTTHIQIFYEGNAADFAWILPVPSLPEVGVGTDVLFSQLEATTAPQFLTRQAMEGTCRRTPSCPSRWDDHWGGVRDASSVADAGFVGDSPGPSGVEVHLRDLVGPYDVAVVSGDDPATLIAWLTDNDYDIPPGSDELIADYVARGNLFVALKLQQDRDVGEIQPVVLRYEEEKPCIPIRLTSIAAVSAMPITAWVLAEHRAAPENYIRVDPRLDDREGLWLGTERYLDVVSRAIDDVGGRGFVTEYAGRVPSIRIEMEDITHLREVKDAKRFMQELVALGFTGDAQVAGILGRFLPPPEGHDARRFYNCLVDDWCGDYDEYLLTLGFAPGALVDALAEAIVAPRRDAQALLDAAPKLTRLFTTMSPEEMTVDPIFDVEPDAPDVPNVHTAVNVTMCSGDYFTFSAPRRLDLPSGRSIPTREGIPYLGSDADYCDDMERGDFGPSAPDDRARDTAARRGRGDRGCSAAGPYAAGTIPVLLGLALLVVGARRRQRSAA